MVNSHIDRLVQGGKLIINKGIIRLSESESKSFQGLIESSQYEANVLRNDFANYFDAIDLEIDKKCEEILIENYLELTIALISKSYCISGNETHENDSYVAIRDILKSKLGEEKAGKVFVGLTEVVSNSEFAKHIASAKLYETLLNSDSSQLISALGGSESLNVYIDSSVVIPIICGLLFNTTKNRYSQSGDALYRLIGEHRFSAIIPRDYIEEVAAHLIEACRDYKHILNEGVDLSYSENAFVSHYSSYVKTAQGKGTSFSDYARIFGVRLNSVSSDMPDSSFFSLRDRVVIEIISIAEKYNFSIEKIIAPHIYKKVEEIKEALGTQGLSKPDVLIRHDARVIKYLSGDYVPSGYVKLLCTWDKLHMHLNPDGRDGYYVMNPIALIDFLSVAKNVSSDYPLSHLLDFALMQSEKEIELSSRIWDSIAKIDKDDLSDAKLMIEAKKFKEIFLEQHADSDFVITEEIAKAWIAWKKTESLKDVAD